MSLYKIARETGAGNVATMQAFRDAKYAFERKMTWVRGGVLAAGLIAQAALGTGPLPTVGAYMGSGLYGDRVVANEISEQFDGHHFNPEAGPSRWEDQIRQQLMAGKHKPEGHGLGASA